MRQTSTRRETESPLMSFFVAFKRQRTVGPKDTAIRWVVVLNDCEKLALQLQGQSASANMMNGKPSLKRKMLSCILRCQLQNTVSACRRAVRVKKAVKDQGSGFFDSRRGLRTSPLRPPTDRRENAALVRLLRLCSGGVCRRCCNLD